MDTEYSGGLMVSNNFMLKTSSFQTWILLKWIISYVKSYWGWVFGNIVASVTLVTINIFSVYLIKEMFNSANNGEQKILGKIIAILISIIIIGILVKYFAKYSSGRFSVATIRDLKNYLSNHLIKTEIDQIEEYHSGDIISSITNDTVTVQNFLENDFSSCFYYPLIIIASFSYMLLINWQLLLICFVVTPIAMVLTNFISKPIRTFSKEYHNSLGEYNSLIDEMVKGIATFKAFNLIKVLNKRYHESIRQIHQAGLKIDLYNSLMLPGIIVMYEFPFVLCIIFGGYFSIKGVINPASLIAFLQLLTLLIYPTTFLPRLLANVRLVAGAVERLYEFAHLQIEDSCKNGFQTQQSEYVIEFDNCSFSYQNSDDVLTDVSFKIPQGKTIALVGASGTGKSTIINLICGFYKLHNGSLKIFGQEISEWEISSLRSLISVVSQDIFLFSNSIAENICYGRLGASKAEIIQASKLAGSHDFIMKMPDGYNTMIGENGIKLSGGERQRISLARAVLKDTPIFLLDEPTTALDSESEALVLKALACLASDRTVLVVAHRLSTIKGAEQILVLDQGKIVERGTHTELMRNNGIYLNLYKEQFAQTMLDNIGGA